MKLTLSSSLLVILAVLGVASASPAATPVPLNVRKNDLRVRQVTDINGDPDDLADDIADAMKSNLAPVVSQLQDTTGALRSRVSSLLTDASFTSDLADQLRDEFGTQTGDAYFTTIQALVAGSAMTTMTDQTSSTGTSATSTGSSSTSASVSSGTNTASGLPGGSTTSVGAGTNAATSSTAMFISTALGSLGVTACAFLL